MRSNRITALMVAALTQVRRWPETPVKHITHAFCLDCGDQVVVTGRTCSECGSESWRPIGRTPLARRAA